MTDFDNSANGYCHRILAFLWSPAFAVLRSSSKWGLLGCSMRLELGKNITSRLQVRSGPSGLTGPAKAVVRLVSELGLLLMLNLTFYPLDRIQTRELVL